jgi:hypothetical protein
MRHRVTIALTLIVGLLVSSVWVEGQSRIRLRGRTSSAGLLDVSEFTCIGQMRTPNLWPPNTEAWGLAMAMREEGGSRQWFTMGQSDPGRDNFASYREPGTLSTCATAQASANQMTFEQDWGPITVFEEDDYVPQCGPSNPNCATQGTGLTWDPVEEVFLKFWASTYSTGGTVPRNSVAVIEPDEMAHTMSTVACFGLEGVNQVQSGGGVMLMPSSFTGTYSASLPASARWAIGTGGHLGYATGNSYGLAAFAIARPANNSCSGANVLVASASQKAMAYNTYNATGPQCAEGPLPWFLDCTPANAPTAPYHMKMAFTGYSSLYATWNPYGGVGYYGSNTAFNPAWYDERPTGGSRYGIVVPMRQPSGWLEDTVQASPAPALVGSGVEFTVSAVDTHDGYVPFVGDFIAVVTCVVGVDTGCIVDNNNHLSVGRISAINTTTKRITVDPVLSWDSASSGTHTPVVGGQVQFGCLYVRGSFVTCSRGTYRMQVIDPAQLGEVAAGSRNHYDVIYSSEADITATLIPNRGGLASGSGINIYEASRDHILSVIPDAPNKRIYVVVQSFVGGNTFNSVYVWGVP